MAFELPLLICRGAQLLFAVITLGITGYVIGEMYSTVNGTYVAFNLMVWSGVLTLLYAGIYSLLIVRFFPSFQHKIAVLALEVFTMLNWLGSFAASAYVVNAHPDLIIDPSWGVWGAAKGGVAMGAFCWLLFIATLVLTTLNNFTSRGQTNQKEAPSNAYPQQQWPQHNQNTAYGQGDYAC